MLPIHKKIIDSKTINSKRPIIRGLLKEELFSYRKPIKTHKDN
jgi:hypothetical protein